jgi:hypothetical protein
LASPQLQALGIVAPRYTQAARRALATGRWPSNQELPVTLEQAVIGFGANRR